MAIEKWITTNEEVIFEHPRLTLIEDTVVLPDGASTKYLRFLRKGDAVTIIARRDDGLILLQREYSHPPNEVLFQFPGGGVPLGEDAMDGANRELMEEAGFRGDLELIGTYFIDNRRTSAKMHVFVAVNLQTAKMQHDAEEFIEHDWYSEQAIDAMIATGDVQNVHALASWLLYKAWLARAA